MRNQEDITIKTLTNAFERLAYNQGLDASRVFDDMMQYIIFGFTANHPPLTNWSYTKDQTAQIYNLMVMWFKVMERETVGREWYDVLGTLYEDTIAGKGRRDNAGQFFTPMQICDLMARVTYTGERIVNRAVGDPTCGSGRTLLAFNAIQQGNYLIAEDLDRTCALMTVCNFLIHGCVGEVIWHDSLQPDSFYGGWRVNDGLNDRTHPFFGVPHCEIIEQSESKVWQHWEERRIKAQDSKIEEAKTEIAQVIEQVQIIESKHGQLTLF